MIVERYDVEYGKNESCCSIPFEEKMINLWDYADAKRLKIVDKNTIVSFTPDEILEIEIIE